MIKAFAHICFVVRDLEAAIDFYQNKLGLRHAFDFRDEQDRRFGVYLHVGDRSFIELFTADHEAASDKSSFRHLCLEVDDIETTVAGLKAQGVEVGPISLGCDQSWQAWLVDPDGNPIELHCYTEKSWQVAALS